VEVNLDPMEHVSCCEKRMTVSKSEPTGAAMPALYFTETEYQARLATTKGEMQASGLDTLILSDPANIFF